MNWNDTVQYYFHTQLGWIEIIASLLTIVCVFQLAKQSMWNFVWGILGVLLFGYIFYESHLYADATLQWGYFFPIQIIGAWQWYYGGDEGKNSLHPSHYSPGELSLGLLGLILGWYVSFFIYKNYTSASYPGWDSYILVASIIAQYLLNKKIVESWYLWISVDMVAVPLYMAKGLYVTSGLYVILLFICIKGLYEWWDDMYVDEVIE